MRDRTHIELAMLAIRVELESLITRREGMLAFNAHRTALGYSIGYDEDAFNYITKQFERLTHEARSLYSARGL